MEKVDLEALDALHAAAHKGYRNASAYIAAVHNAYPAMAAELRALREQIQMIREYNEALREERDRLRKSIQDTISLAHELGWNGVENSKIMAVFLRDHIDTLRAEVAELKAKWKREECAHCDELPGGHEGTIWCAECFNWHCSEAAKERMQSELDAAMAEAARLREALVYCRREFESHAGEDYSVMICDEALDSTPTTAEWLAERDAEQRRIGAAEWIEKAAAENLERFGTHFYESTTDSMLAEAARLRTGV